MVTITARSLRVGDCVLTPMPTVVESIEWLNRLDNAVLIVGGRERKTAMAIRLRFVGDPSPHLVHPGQEFRFKQGAPPWWLKWFVH